MRCFQTIPDSDQSISDEEEPDQDWPNKCATIAGSTAKKEELELPSRLEMLKGAHGYACNLEDDVSSDDDEGSNVLSRISDTVRAKKLQKDGVHSFGGDKEEGSCTWSVVNKEAEALMLSNEKTSCSSSHSAYSKVNKSSKGVKSKGRPKFSFRFPAHKEGSSWLSVSKDENDVLFKIEEIPERLDAIEPRTEKNLDAELLEDIQGEEENQLEIVPIEFNDHSHVFVEQSMADLLDGLQDKTTTTMPRASFKMYSRKRRKRVQPIVKTVSPLGDRAIDSESSPEHLGCGSPSDSEANDKILKLDESEVKRQTLVDRFQEALGDKTLVAAPKALRIGLFGQLQQVLQTEKESDMEFLKNIEKGANQNEPGCIDVKILSRCLDAKLTVCHCSFGNNLESLPWPENPRNTVNEETTWTIIFNPRVCNDVDLDVGKWIRIHPPWKEIPVGSDKSIILSTYFSEIST